MLSGYPSGPSTGTYSIDGGPPVSFNISGLLFDWTTRYQQPIFSTPTLSPGQHNITVKYLGSSTPLNLEYLLVQDGDILFTGAGAPPNMDVIDGHGVAGNGGTSKGVIIGAAVGGVAFLGLLVVIFFLLRTLRRRRALRIFPIDSSPTDAHPPKNHNFEAAPFMRETASNSVPPSPSPFVDAFSQNQSQNHNMNRASYMTMNSETPLITTNSNTTAFGHAHPAPQTQAQAQLQPQGQHRQSAYGPVTLYPPGEAPPQTQKPAKRAPLNPPSYPAAGPSTNPTANIGASSSSNRSSTVKATTATPNPNVHSGGFGTDEKVRLRYMEEMEERNSSRTSVSTGGAGAGAGRPGSFNVMNRPAGEDFMQHEDSGLRLGPDGVIERERVEAPPQYTSF